MSLDVLEPPLDPPAETSALGRVRAVAAVPGAAKLILASLVSAIPAGAIGVLLVLHVRALGGSYALAGLTAGAYGFGGAASAPLVGRAVDRFGQTIVLALGAALTGLALVALAVAPAGAPGAVPVVLALIGGLTHPPVGACTRTLLPDVIDDEDVLHSAYALESSALEASYIGGLLLVGLLTTFSTRLALAASAAMLVGGIAWFCVQPASRRWRPGTLEARRSLLGALASARVVVLLATLTCFAVSFGGIEVAVNAFASEQGHQSLTGPLVAAWGVGSLLGGLLAAGAKAPTSPRRRLVALLVGMGLVNAMLVLLTGTWALVAVLPVAGLAIAPAFAIVHNMAGLAASSGTSTEAFAWLGTGVSAGFAVGGAAAGALADAGGAQAAFGLAAGASISAALLFAGAWRAVGGGASAD